MNMNLLTTTFRRIFRNQTNSIINFVGLALSMITFLLIFSWISQERNYDRFWPDHNRMYRVTLSTSSSGNPILSTAMNYSGVGPVLQNDLPEVEAATNLSKDVVTIFTPGKSFQDVNLFYMDTSFFKIFPRSLQTLNSNIFADIHGAVLSRSMAKKLFGNANPLNQQFKLNEGWEFFVCAVFDDVPANSHISFDVLIQRKALFYYMRNFNYTTGLLDNSHIGQMTDQDPYGKGNWKAANSYTYIKLKPRCAIPGVETKYARIIQPCIKHISDAGEQVKFTFQPVSDIHLTSHLTGEISVNGSKFRIIAFAVIALLIIIISWFNFINLSIAVYLKQSAKDYIRRVAGATKFQIFIQHMLETSTVYAIAGFFSLTVVFLLLGKGLHVAGFEIAEINYFRLGAICFGLVITGSMVSSFYTFYKVVIKQSATHSKTTAMKRKRMFSREAMIVFKFGMAIFLLIGTTIVFKQIQFMQEQDLGMHMEQIMVSYSPMTMIKKPSLALKLNAFKDEIRTVPGVISFVTTEAVPGKNFRRTSNNVHFSEKQENKFLFSLTNVDQQYFPFFSIKMLAGSNFSLMPESGSNEVVINKTACRMLGITDPSSSIDRMLTVNEAIYRVVGVADDYHHLSLKDEIAPVLFFKSINWTQDVGYYCIRISPENRKKTIDGVKSAWERTYPGEPYLFSFLDDNYNALYEDDKRFGKIYFFFSAVAIFIACMGLFAIAKFSANNKIKEIGIRKVNGSSIFGILILLNKEFAGCVILAFGISSPIAYYIMNKWLQSFAYKMEISWWIFVMAGTGAFMIAIVTVSWQSWKAATKNPVEALRYE
jgi:putative ABC transport system permease protein